MIVSDAGLKLIAEFEGFAGYLYNDPVGHSTVAYGFLVHTGNYHEQRGICAACDRWPRKREPRNTWITPEQGRALLREKVRSYADAVERTSRPLTQPEFDALTSFCFNVGPGGYINSSVRRAVNGGGDVCFELKKYVRGTDGVTYPGLVRRRAAECVMFHGAAPIEQEDEMWVRINGRADWWTNRALAQQAQDGVMQLGTDFPHLPATAKAVDIEVHLDPAATGALVFKDGDGNYAGQFNQNHRQGVIRIVPKDRTARFQVLGAVRTQLVGIVGYLA